MVVSLINYSQFGIEIKNVLWTHLFYVHRRRLALEGIFGQKLFVDFDLIRDSLNVPRNFIIKVCFPAYERPLSCTTQCQRPQQVPTVTRYFYQCLLTFTTLKLFLIKHK